MKKIPLLVKLCFSLHFIPLDPHHWLKVQDPESNLTNVRTVRTWQVDFQDFNFSYLINDSKRKAVSRRIDPINKDSLKFKFIFLIYWVPQKLPQIWTVIVCICIGKVAWFAVYICAKYMKRLVSLVFVGSRLGLCNYVGSI